MARLMSVTLTVPAVEARIKTVSRRANWWEDKHGRRLLHPGDHLDLCKKVMGRKPGEPLERLAHVKVTDVRRERLSLITDADVYREGFTSYSLTGYLNGTPQQVAPGALATAFCRFYVDHMGGSIHQTVTRIEWEYAE